MGLIGFGLGLIIFHGVSPRDSVMANYNKITARGNVCNIYSHYLNCLRAIITADMTVKMNLLQLSRYVCDKELGFQQHLFILGLN